MNQHDPRTITTSRRGYTLLEISVVLAIIATVLGLSLTAGSMQLRVASHQGTRNNMETVRDALDLYSSKNNRYPCPASLTDAGAGYGIEVAGCDTACPAGLSCPAGGAVIGAVPFVTLGINKEVALDKWGGRIVYALDRVHAKDSRANLGTLVVRDAGDNDILQSSAFGDAIYVLISHGPNGLGAYSASGVQNFACGAGSLEVENCDHTIPAGVNSIFRDATRTQATIDASVFDDEVLWKTQDWGNASGTEQTEVPANANLPQGNLPGPAAQTRVATWWTVSCGINNQAQLYCWGENDHGRAGNGSDIGAIDATIESKGYTDWASITTHLYTSCGVRKGGLGYCWGSQGTAALNWPVGVGPNPGAIGSGTNNDTLNTPQRVLNYNDWVHISTSLTTCGLRTNGTIMCWGAGDTGMLGDGTSSSFATIPQPIHGPTGLADAFNDWANIEVWDHACAVRTNGLGYCWGTKNNNGQIGIGTTGTGPTRPTLVGGGITNWKRIVPGTSHSCGVTQNGRAFCWGRNADGELGDGSYVQRTLPTEIQGAYTDWDLVDAGDLYSCGLRKGVAYCWGSSAANRLGVTGTPEANYSTPQPVSGGISDWVMLESSSSHTCGLRSDDRIWCWGDESRRQLGRGAGSGSNTPVQASSFTP